MDLSTIRAKLQDGQYEDRFQFARDIQLIVDNANLYNAPGSPVAKQADKLLAEFQKCSSEAACSLVCPRLLTDLHPPASPIFQSGLRSTVRGTLLFFSKRTHS
jgi:hypothetical protein